MDFMDTLDEGYLYARFRFQSFLFDFFVFSIVHMAKLY